MIEKALRSAMGSDDGPDYGFDVHVECITDVLHDPRRLDVEVHKYVIAGIRSTVDTTELGYGNDKHHIGGLGMHNRIFTTPANVCFVAAPQVEDFFRSRSCRVLGVRFGPAARPAIPAELVWGRGGWRGVSQSSCTENAYLGVYYKPRKTVYTKVAFFQISNCSTLVYTISPAKPYTPRSRFSHFTCFSQKTVYTKVAFFIL